jgi:hypothetical protein
MNLTDRVAISMNRQPIFVGDLVESSIGTVGANIGRVRVIWESPDGGLWILKEHADGGHEAVLAMLVRVTGGPA